MFCTVNYYLFDRFKPRVDNKRRVSHGAIISVASQRRSRLSRPFMPVNLFY